MELTVKPIKKKDASLGLAAISEDAMDELNIEVGGFVRIAGESSTVVRVTSGYSGDSGTIRIDGHTRGRVGTHIDQQVTVEKATVNTAEKITIALPKSLNLQGNFPAPHQLIGQVAEDNTVLNFSVVGGVNGSNQSIPALVTETEPSGAVLITGTTTINVSDTPFEELGAEDANSESLVTYEGIGGLSKELEQVREMVELPMRHPELFDRLGIAPPRGVLLHGPPGTGKTLMAEAVANEIDAEFFTISGPEIMSKYYGESEQQLRQVFENAADADSAVIFIDEIDSIAPERGEASGDVERRIVAQLLSLMDGLESDREVVVIGATNRVDALDPALRRGGRFDREIEVGVPDKEGRREILDVHTRGVPLADDIDLDHYTESTHGFVGADIEALVKEAAMIALRRVRPDLNLERARIPVDVLNEIEVQAQDFKNAMREVDPSALREVFVEVPDVTWGDVGGLKETEERLRESVQWPLDFPDVFADMDINAPKGILLYGPPGTGKTLMAKAVANESESNFISVKGPELLNKYVGESEKGVREVFEKARSNAPTVVFFDEIDAIASARGSGDSGNNVNERVVSQLLTELDGLEALEGVTVIATTNRPDLIDSALLRPGRLDRHIHVPVPNQQARRKVLEVHTRSKPIADTVDLNRLAQETDGYVGADLESLVREASMIATRSLINGAESQAALDSTETLVTMEHFNAALEEVGPSVTAEVREQYEQIEQQFDKASIEEDEEQEMSRTFQ